jgi:hypothetical protein
MKHYCFLILFVQISFSVSAVPNWSDDIAKIIYGNCSSCHHTGGIGPYPLMSYQDAYNNANDIQDAVTLGDMPPWTPDPTYKRYVHERLLSAADVQAIQQWVAAGAPSGDLRFAPTTPVYNNTSTLGNVNLSLRIPSYTVTSNNDVYRNFVLPSGLSQSKYVTAVEIIPGNTAIVHHVLVYQDSTNNSISSTSAGGTGSTASKLLFGYTPGATPYHTPLGTGFRLAANTRIILQIHYAPGSNGQSDSTRVNFKLSSSPLREIEVAPLLNHYSSLTNGPLHISANQTKTFNEVAPVVGDWTFLYVFPHMHLIGKTIKSYATTPTPGDTIPFVNIPNWEFHWQDNFVFPNTVKVPNGSVLHATAFYDNTSANPENPSSPPQSVSAGESTLDEMMIVFFAYMPYQAGDEDLIVDRRILPMGSTTLCDGSSIELRTISGNGYTYQWNRNGTTIAGATTSKYIANQSGQYSVFISLGSNSTYSDTISVTVNPVPVANIIPPGSTIIPAGGSITLNASTGTGYSYHWYLNGVAINGAINSSYAATQGGNYSVEVFNGCYSVSNSIALSAPYSSVLNTTSNPVSGGTTSGSGNYATGSSVTVVANPNSGYTFTNWTEGSNIVSTNASYTFNIGSATNLVANFSLISYNVSTSSSPVAGGTTSGSGNFTAGSNVTVVATPNSGYTFTNWTQGSNIVSTNASYTFNIGTATNLVANFSLVSYNVSTSSSPVAGGTTSGSGNYTTGSTVTVVASPNASYSFINWTSGSNIISTNASYTFTIGSTTSLVANFSLVSYHVGTSASPVAGGTTSGSGNYVPGSNVTVVATPNIGYVFSNWTDGGTIVSTNASYTFNISSVTNLVANFSLISYNVSTSSSPVAGGTTSGSGNYTFGSNVTVIATPDSGYTFINWTDGSNVVSTNASYTFNVGSTINLVANFSLVSYNVSTSASPVTGGTTSGSGNYTTGSIVTVIATPDSGYTFTNWTEGSNVVSTNASYTFTIVSATNLVANFVSNVQQFNVTTISNPANAGVTNGDGTYVSGAVVQVMAISNAGYVFQSWTENSNVVSLNPVYTFTLTSNDNLVANFSSLTGIEDKLDGKNFVVYPNPSTGVMKVFSQNETSLEVFDNIGRRILLLQLKAGIHQLDLTAKGIYLFRFGNDFTQQVVVE